MRRSQKQNVNQTIENNLEIIPGLTTENRNMIIRMIESGVDEKDIPYILGIDKRHSITSWENQDPAVRHLFDKAREAVLNKVENSLLRTALGGTLTTVKSGGKLEEDEVTVKEVGPNVAAAVQILKLFRPEVWAKLGEDDEVEITKTPTELGQAEVDRMKKLGGKFMEVLKSEVVETVLI